jgi:hypothetical protein
MVEPLDEMKYDEMKYDEMKYDEMKYDEMKYDEMVYNKEEGKIMAGGYLVNSLLLNEGKPVAYSNDIIKGGKGKFSDRFKHLAVPAGLLYIPMHSDKIPIIHNNDMEVVNDDLYEKLLKLAREDKGKEDDKEIKMEHNNKKKMTKKKKKTTKKKTIKNKTKRK